MVIVAAACVLVDAMVVAPSLDDMPTVGAMHAEVPSIELTIELAVAWCDRGR
jgi:hypothetical protein